MTERIFVPFFKGTGYVMDVPETGVTVESVRDFMLVQLQKDSWFTDLVVSATHPDEGYGLPDELIGYVPPDTWRWKDST